ncbi:Major facilitator superfamily domain general substrate transporter [Penicillium robsamsonii]|uniref:Major facilitator superfamily domain general substrate transporter n=1 Tax=Penicillium robsamsonii TaxID=1792511 RepID=UPI0025475DB0|nr:Major facilitator superfamily domain general substrate transporter [Penicillium robsamsonii]KAJ5837027.1 Major facilitator superfamily domain general substrate transporter [Penicillium robsamsonii]
MIENPQHSSPTSSDNPDETTSLLPEQIEPHDASTTFGFWIFLLSGSRLLTALVVTVLTTAILTGFHATLPLHTGEGFGWKPRQIGKMFFLSVPALFPGTLAGWLRDRIVVRLTITISRAIHAIFHVLVGVAGDDHLLWARLHHRGPVRYISSICLGVLRPFVPGVGPVKVTGEFKFAYF